MKCVVPNQNVKVLAKAFHSLAKIGEDLFIEPHQNYIAFRTVNMAESAYASFHFSKNFFSSFTFSENENEETLRCKIAMKSLLVVLKMQHSTERFIEWCQIRLDENGTQVIFQLRYSYGCTKTYFLPILESETLQANYSKDECQNRLSITPKLLSTTVKNFRRNEDEVTLSVLDQKLVLRNHIENNLDSKKALKTEICLYPAECETYTIGAPTSVTFCLNELKAVLLFAEYTGLPIQFYLSTAGKPVVFEVNNDNVYESNYVVSTLSESESSQSLSQASESSATTSSREPLSKRPRQDVEKIVPDVLRPSDNSRLSMDPLPDLNGSVRVNISGVSAFNHNSASQFSEPVNISKDSNITQPIVNDVFGRCFNATFHKQTLPGSNKVLAYDSDGMEDSD